MALKNVQVLHLSPDLKSKIEQKDSNSLGCSQEVAGKSLPPTLGLALLFSRRRQHPIRALVEPQLVHFQSSSLLPSIGKQQKVSQTLGPLPHMCKIQMDSRVLAKADPTLIKGSIWGVKAWMSIPCVSLFVSASLFTDQ